MPNELTFVNQKVYARKHERASPIQGSPCYQHEPTHPIPLTQGMRPERIPRCQQAPRNGTFVDVIDANLDIYQRAQG